jgi:hypothetical protein
LKPYFLSLLFVLLCLGDSCFCCAVKRYFLLQMSLRCEESLIIIRPSLNELIHSEIVSFLNKWLGQQVKYQYRGMEMYVLKLLNQDLAAATV